MPLSLSLSFPLSSLIFFPPFHDSFIVYVRLGHDENGMLAWWSVATVPDSVDAGSQLVGFIPMPPCPANCGRLKSSNGINLQSGDIPVDPQTVPCSCKLASRWTMEASRQDHSADIAAATNFDTGLCRLWIQLLPIWARKRLLVKNCWSA